MGVGKQAQREDGAPAGGTWRGQKELEEEVIRAGRCTGCGACVNLCPYQALYRDRTVTLHACDLDRGRCYAYCPRTPADVGSLRVIPGAQTDWTEELGPVRGFFITRVADQGMRSRSQHGGTVSALMALALRAGMIDAAVLTSRGEGLLPKAVTVTDPDEAARAGGSRFVVSPTLAEFNRLLPGPHQRIGIVATPCQALALAKRRLAPLAPAESSPDKLSLVLGLFCGWALSWQALSALVSAKTDMTRLTGMDIPPSRYHTLELYRPEGPLSLSLDEVTPCIRESCRSCDDMTAEFSDLSVGSARLPEGWEEAKGWNQVLVRTPRGEALLELARREGVLEFREVPEGNLGRLQAASLGKKRAAERVLREQQQGLTPEGRAC